MSAELPTPIAEFPDYGATRDGKIWTSKSGAWRELVGSSKGKGGAYLKVKLYFAPCRYRQIAVHTLIATTFIGLRPSAKHCVNHEDGRPLNNCAQNLSWMTAKEQMAHARRIGLWKPQTSPFTPEERRAKRRDRKRRYRLRHPGPGHCHGERVRNRKLSADDVGLMRCLAAEHSLSTLSILFGVSKNTAWRIVRRLKWRRLA